MKREKGISLVESLLVIVIITAVVTLLTNLPNAISLISKSNNLSLAREIASKQLEDERGISYANLANGSSAVSDPRIASLPQGSGIVLIEDCEASICTYSEHIKKVTVTILWKENGKDQEISLKTFIGEGGLNQ